MPRLDIEGKCSKTTSKTFLKTTDIRSFVSKVFVCLVTNPGWGGLNNISNIVLLDKYLD